MAAGGREPLLRRSDIAAAVSRSSGGQASQRRSDNVGCLPFWLDASGITGNEIEIFKYSLDECYIEPLDISLSPT